MARSRSLIKRFFKSLYNKIKRGLEEIVQNAEAIAILILAIIGLNSIILPTIARSSIFQSTQFISIVGVSSVLSTGIVYTVAKLPQWRKGTNV